MRKTTSLCIGLSILMGLLTIAPTGCDVLFPGQDAPWQSAFGLGDLIDNVTLRIENQSGLPVDVQATFTSKDQEVRRTSRRLSAAGDEAFEEIVPTGAEVVTVVARRIAADRSTTATTNDVLQSRVFHRGVDFTGTETIIFAILPVDEPTPPAPLPIIDCNNNNLADSDEITADPSTDCNDDKVLDECQNLTDCNEDSIPDECQVLADCNEDGTPDDCQYLPDHNENGTPDACEIQGDFDGDGLVTMDDLSLFLQLLLGNGQEGQFTGADLNGDGMFDGRDIQPLVNLILARP